MSAPDAASVPVLALEGVTLTARVAGREVALLREITFRLARGRVLGLVGESGAGKSMIGRLVSGFLPDGFAITGGSIRFAGRDLRAATPEARRALLGREIAFIPQEPLSALNPVLTIGQQFDEHLERIGTAAGARRERASALLAEVGLPTPAELLHRYPHELSGGQCQRVFIAMAFASNPALIVADEPTTALDVVTQARIMALLAKEQRAHGTAVILITHDLRLAAHVCDEIGVMYAGDLVEHGPADAVLRAPVHPYTRTLKAANPPLEGPRRALPAVADLMPGLALIADMPGCRFASRCHTRADACANAVPPLRECAPGHRVRCADACAADPGALALAMELPAAAAPDRDATPLVELVDVGLRYTQRRGLFANRVTHVDAVKQATFLVSPGEFVGIVGESGSGKSSIARLVMGLERPTSGTIRIDGAAVGAGGGAPEMIRVARDAVQMVFQDPQSALNPRRTVMQLVTQALEVPGRATPGTDRLARASTLLRETGLPADCLERFPAQLSGGQKQRVNIARALCVTPRLLVADEIVSGLDVSVQAQILNLLLRLGTELGIGLLFISHDLSVVRYLCSRVLVMHRGEIVESGPTAEVFATPRHPYTRTLLDAVPPDDADKPWPPSVDSGAIAPAAARGVPA
jgi:peptide/nickel transport system ATP-binding protein